MIFRPSWLPVLMAFAIAASLAVPGARLVWHSLGDSAANARDLPAPAPRSDTLPTDLSSVIAWSPFGAPPSPVTAVAELSQPDIDMVLKGIAISTNPNRSAAFIHAGGRTDRYEVDDTILDGVTLRAVAPDHVQLDIDGETRFLSFPNADLPTATEPEIADIEDAPSPLARLREAIVPGERREKPEPVPPQTIEDHIDLWRDRIRRNPAEVLDLIGLVPGERGYTIAEEHDSGVGMIGLRAGDLVTRVNGQPVGNVERDRRLYDEIATAGFARIEIERGGETITMSFPLR